MVAANNGAPEKPGGRGEGTHLSPVQENKIVGMMLNPRRRWKLGKEAKRAAVAATLDNLADKDGRVRNAAVANLIRMEGQNQSDQHKSVDKHLPDLQAVSGVVEHRVSVPELLANPEYVEWLRERERHSIPGPVCPNGHEGNGHALANGESRNGHRP